MIFLTLKSVTRFRQVHSAVLRSLRRLRVYPHASSRQVPHPASAYEAACPSPPDAVTARVMAAMSCSTSGLRACWPAEASSIRAAAIRLLRFAACGLCRSSHTLQVVVLNGAALPHSCTLGYSEQDYDQLPLLSIDGRSIRNLVDVALAQVPLATFMFNNECEIVLPLPDSVRGRRPPWNSCATSASSRRGRRMSRQVCAALLFVCACAHVAAALELRRAAAGSAEM